MSLFSVIDKNTRKVFVVVISMICVTAMAIAKTPSDIMKPVIEFLLWGNGLFIASNSLEHLKALTGDIVKALQLKEKVSE